MGSFVAEAAALVTGVGHEGVFDFFLRPLCSTTQGQKGRQDCMGRQDRRGANLAALPLVAPFVLVYLTMFIYPSLQGIAGHELHLEQPDGPGPMGGLGQLHKANWRQAVLRRMEYAALCVDDGCAGDGDRAWACDAGQPFQRVLASGGACGAVPALCAAGLDGQFDRLGADRSSVQPLWAHLPARRRPGGSLVQHQLFLPGVAVLTIWWTTGFNVLVFLAGLKMLPQGAFRCRSTVPGAGRVFPRSHGR